MAEIINICVKELFHDGELLSLTFIRPRARGGFIYPSRYRSLITFLKNTSYETLENPFLDGHSVAVNLWHGHLVRMMGYAMMFT